MKITLTAQEIIAKFGLPADTELVIGQIKSEWISNVGRDLDSHPRALKSTDRIEVMHRDGETDTGRANDWESTWKETDGHPRNIVAYRIL